MVSYIILIYASFAVVDILDKFLLTKRQIRPLSYTFFTVVTGGLLFVLWPFVYSALPLKFIGLNLFSGAYFGLAMYFYFKVLSLGEVSRVVPVIFSLVPVFDSVFSFIFHTRALLPAEVAAMCLLIPGALLLAYYPDKNFFGHLGLKILCAFLISSYNWLWQYGAQMGPSLNNLMWNRMGAVLAMVALLLIPLAKKNIFKVDHVPKKQHTSFLFLVKQGLGGLNFIFLSYFLAKPGKVLLVDSLSGFRYLVLFLLALFFSFYHKRVLSEEVKPGTVKLKLIAMALICSGTAILLFV